MKGFAISSVPSMGQMTVMAVPRPTTIPRSRDVDLEPSSGFNISLYKENIALEQKSHKNLKKLSNQIWGQLPVAVQGTYRVQAKWQMSEKPKKAKASQGGK